jgi:hypothetical protein
MDYGHNLIDILRWMIGINTFLRLLVEEALSVYNIKQKDNKYQHKVKDYLNAIYAANINKFMLIYLYI